MIFLQNEINWSCAGDSGSPLVKVVHPPSGQPYFKLIGVLQKNDVGIDRSDLIIVG